MGSPAELISALTAPLGAGTQQAAHRTEHPPPKKLIERVAVQQIDSS